MHQVFPFDYSISAAYDVLFCLLSVMKKYQCFRKSIPKEFGAPMHIVGDCWGLTVCGLLGLTVCRLLGADSVRTVGG